MFNNEKEMLNAAIESLNITYVLISSTVTGKKKGFFQAEVNDDVRIETFGGTESFRLSEKRDDHDEKIIYIYDFSAGVRLVDTTQDSEDESYVIAKVEADFEAIYSSKEILDENCLNVFGKKNVQFHVWPFWREFVQSSCLRMGISPIPVSMYKIDNDLES